MVSLDWKQIEELKRQGYSENDIQEAINLYEQEEFNNLSDSYSEGLPADNSAVQSSFQTQQTDDLARWQLELDDILERAEHMLRGDIIKYDPQRGITYWVKNPHPETNPLNDIGVHLLMKILSSYVNRNTILANYKDEEIKLKVLMFSQELNDLIFMKYDELGMDNEDKRKEYPMIVMMLKDIVHSAYSRAKFGGERESLRKNMTISGTYHADNPNVPQQPSRTGLSSYLKQW